MKRKGGKEGADGPEKPRGLKNLFNTAAPSLAHVETNERVYNVGLRCVGALCFACRAFPRSGSCIMYRQGVLGPYMYISRARERERERGDAILYESTDLNVFVICRRAAGGENLLKLQDDLAGSRDPRQ